MTIQDLAVAVHDLMIGGGDEQKVGIVIALQLFREAKIERICPA
ncbi:hypothetical protein [Paenibacillus humicus]|nr:hypothetical protein [Paenibacillus humicus]